MTYHADIKHEFRNPGRGACEFFLVIDASQAARRLARFSDPVARPPLAIGRLGPR